MSTQWLREGRLTLSRQSCLVSKERVGWFWHLRFMRHPVTTPSPFLPVFFPQHCHPLLLLFLPPPPTPFFPSPPTPLFSIFPFFATSASISVEVVKACPFFPFSCVIVCLRIFVFWLLCVLQTASLGWWLSCPSRERKIRASIPVCTVEIFFLVETYQTPVATLPGAWRYRVSTGTDWPVSVYCVLLRSKV